MTYKEISKLDRSSIPAGKEAEYAELIKKYIIHKNKITKGFIMAFTFCFAAAMLFIIIGRSAGIYSDYPAVFWSVTGVMGGAAVAFAVVVGINMFRFHKFLKRFE